MCPYPQEEIMGIGRLYCHNFPKVKVKINIMKKNIQN